MPVGVCMESEERGGKNSPNHSSSYSSPTLSVWYFIHAEVRCEKLRIRVMEKLRTKLQKSI